MKRSKIVPIVLIAILLLAAYLRIDFVRSVAHVMPHDSINYDLMVRQLLEQGVYAYKDTSPNARVTPGYPLFMAAIYWLSDYQQNDPLPWVRMVQVMLSLLSVWMIYSITRRLSNAAGGLIAAFLAAIYPPFVWANGAILTEVLGIFLLLGHVWAQLRVYRAPTLLSALASGILLGLTVLVRPEFLPLIAVNYLFYWLWKRNAKEVLKLLALSIIGLALVLMPWWIRNAVTLDEWVLTATQSNPFKAGTYPYKNYDDGMVDEAGKTEMEVAVERLKTGFSTQPWLFIKWYTVGKLSYLYAHVYYGGGHAPFYNVIPGLHPDRIHHALLVLGVLAAVVILRRWRQISALLVVIVAAITLIRLGFVPEYRYNVMTMPLIIMIDCIVGVKAWQWLSARRRLHMSKIEG
ncbi:glycosyltransferase family 39 protein [Paenibacillus sp. J5C_2022]|uniref:ArnT family glycosyltransferase n=1 Tax=Paenibacillus sp. J5C2022 TaxID=2977129 RepID=UPI0021D04A30|nr:glycosyltransferase family 39 protein [Paenibacillus sp. J5C2022]MCU6709058.1 glycosyltransferase family 39 protein [Paenibacillus sp. J5C2022]